jgi:L-alanine-DL-glutamate epimerase-like enolase superfamily enzyme
MTGNKTSDLLIKQIDAWPVDIELTDAFVISQGSISVAQTLFVRITLASGVAGFGEAAPFTPLTGEDRESSREAINRLSTQLIGQPVTSYRELSSIMSQSEPHQPAARCGLEIAILDSLCRSLEIPVWALFGGGNVRPLETDVTIPILSVERTIELARHWLERGFKVLKLKVGEDVDKEIEIVKRLLRINPDVRFRFDANQGFNEIQALSFIGGVLSLGCNVELFEQPIDKKNLDGMARIKESVRVPIAADESVFTLGDLSNVINKKAADVVNLKIMKSGVIETINIATTAVSAGLKLMIGGMVETRLAMSCSLAIAMGFGGIDFLDLDTPLLMRTDPVQGGYQYDGSIMSVWDSPGLGITPKILH